MSPLGPIAAALLACNGIVPPVPQPRAIAVFHLAAVDTAAVQRPRPHTGAIVGGIVGGAALGAGFYHFSRRSTGVNGATGSLGATLVGAALGTAGGALIGAFVDAVIRRR